jgi:ubiquinol-cytochrome c reductase cytochrome b subunit
MNFLNSIRTCKYLTTELIHRYLLILFFYGIGSLLGLNLIILIITGISLAMHYNNPSVELAFSSSEHIVRDVNNGWLLRYICKWCVFIFFMKVYAHIGKALYYGSYIDPRVELYG